MQNLVFVALFRRESRDRMMDALEGMMPARLPWLDVSPTQVGSWGLRSGRGWGFRAES